MQSSLVYGLIFLSGSGANLLAVIHVDPNAIEPPSDIIDLDEPRVVGWFAFTRLVGFVALLAASSFLRGGLVSPTAGTSLRTHDWSSERWHSPCVGAAVRGSFPSSVGAARNAQ